jgi:hypothetical protein
MHTSVQLWKRKQKLNQTYRNSSLLRNLKSLFCKNENKSWMVEAKYFKKIKNGSQKILTNFFVSEVFIKNVIFSMLLMIIKV